MPHPSVRQVYEVASTGAAIREKVALELSASWPVPIRKAGGYAFKFFYYRLSGPPRKPSFDIYPPVMVVEIDADGRPDVPADVSPATLGLRSPPGVVLGTHAWPASWTQSQIDAKVVGLLEAYDRMIPLWLSHGSAADPRGEDFARRFVELSEPTLLPYYRALGPDFFAWIGLSTGK